MRGQAEGPRKASQGLNKGCGNTGETLDQCQRKVDLMLHVSWGRVVDVWKVLQGLARVKDSGRRSGGRSGRKEEEAERKTEAETDERWHKDEEWKETNEERLCELFGAGKGSLHVLTCGLWHTICHDSRMTEGEQQWKPQCDLFSPSFTLGCHPAPLPSGFSLSV